MVPSDLGGVVLVTGDGDSQQALPLIVAIHGLGDDPEHFASLFQGFDTPARVVAPQGPMPRGRGYMWMDPSGDDHAAQVDESADRIAGLIQEIQAAQPVRGRAVVTGFSQGGILSFVLAARHPRLVGTAVPVSGQLPSRMWPTGPASSASPVVTALHGAADRMVAPMPARRGVVKLRSLGWDARIRLYEGVEHRISPRMRRDLYGLLRAAIEGFGDGVEPCRPCPGESVDPASCSLCSD